ncbi:hypothetical protein [Desulfobacter postgatei]|jgi:hypothetical protein|uniref:hypothetical protein n=1 Tax=Desulfobacter postgatei TaxID=2293 RepID=UPI002A371F17|nr:hypothetical protein [Desulfobacter postgatei]MDX9965366.1 hypothetical protein [Desulfobacter postgatei]
MEPTETNGKLTHFILSGITGKMGMRPQDGTLIDLYNGADENTIFPFYNVNDANDDSLVLDAYTALDEQVLINQFDETPGFINGVWGGRLGGYLDSYVDQRFCGYQYRWD